MRELNMTNELFLDRAMWKSVIIESEVRTMTQAIGSLLLLLLLLLLLMYALKLLGTKGFCFVFLLFLVDTYTVFLKIPNRFIIF